MVKQSNISVEKQRFVKSNLHPNIKCVCNYYLSCTYINNLHSCLVLFIYILFFDCIYLYLLIVILFFSYHHQLPIPISFFVSIVNHFCKQKHLIPGCFVTISDKEKEIEEYIDYRYILNQVGYKIFNTISIAYLYY
jgi:hypothetical protein